jgi:hypothetical protein
MVLNALSLTETTNHSASCLRLLCNLLHLAATLVQPLAALPPCSSFCTLLQPRAVLNLYSNVLAILTVSLQPVATFCTVLLYV